MSIKEFSLRLFTMKLNGCVLVFLGFWVLLASGLPLNESTPAIDYEAESIKIGRELFEYFSDLQKKALTKVNITNFDDPDQIEKTREAIREPQKLQMKQLLLQTIKKYHEIYADSFEKANDSKINVDDCLEKRARDKEVEEEIAREVYQILNACTTGSFIKYQNIYGLAMQFTILRERVDMCQLFAKKYNDEHCYDEIYPELKRLKDELKKMGEKYEYFYIEAVLAMDQPIVTCKKFITEKSQQLDKAYSDLGNSINSCIIDKLSSQY